MNESDRDTDSGGEKMQMLCRLIFIYFLSKSNTDILLYCIGVRPGIADPFILDSPILLDLFHYPFSPSLSSLPLSLLFLSNLQHLYLSGYYLFL